MKIMLTVLTPHEPGIGDLPVGLTLAQADQSLTNFKFFKAPINHASLR